MGERKKKAFAVVDKMAAAAEAERLKVEKAKALATLAAHAKQEESKQVPGDETAEEAPGAGA